MSLRLLAASVAVLGGGAWVLRWTAGDPGWGGAAHWVGLALLLVALAVVGAGLVSRSARWLRAIVGVAFPVLVWSVYAVVRGDDDAVTLDGVVGALAVAWGLALAVIALRVRKGDTDADARPGPAGPPRRRPGSHAR